MDVCSTPAVKSAHRSARAVTVGVIVALSMTLVSGNAIAATATPGSTAAGISTTAPQGDIDDVLNRRSSFSSEEQGIRAAELAAHLADAGYVNEGVVRTPQGSAYTYTIRDDSYTISYLVPINSETIVPVPDFSTSDRKINLGWDNGPRLYMTGTDFWNLGKIGLQEMCGRLPWGSVACNKFVERLWTGNLTGPGRILNDSRCWDLSQTLNVGWRPASPEKCA